MQLKAEQLHGQLRDGLTPVYFLTGDEPLQLREAVDAIRAAARAAGYGEREVLDVEPGFDWSRLSSAGANLSLFGDRRVLELRMPGGKPGQEGSKAIAAWCERPPEDTVLLVSAGRLEAAQRKAAWVKALERAGVMIQVWPIGAAELPRWLAARARSAGLNVSREAIALLAERSEGNLMAAVQELEKLYLLHGEDAVDLEKMTFAVADSARHDVFDLATAAFSGNRRRVIRITGHLREEGAEPVLVLWALAGGTRASAQIRSGVNAREALRNNRLFGGLAQAVEQAARRGDRHRWERLLVRCASVDRTIKGGTPGQPAAEPWSELLDLAVAIAGLGARP
ncbi:MAG: DNA polymerase III subunit delta [Aquisalimonadaceae bacterium]